MSRPVLTVVSIIMLLTAGCSGLMPATTPTPTPTPAPVPSDLPPGVTETGVRNASALISAHEQLLATNPHAVTVVEVRRHADGSLLGRFDAERRVRPDQGRSHTVYHLEGTGHGIGQLQNGSRFETYRDDQRVYGVESNSTATRYFQATTTRQSVDPLDNPLMVVFSATGMRVQELGTRTGPMLYRFEAVRITQPVLLGEALVDWPHDSVKNMSFSALVGADGFIHEYHLGYTFHYGGTTIHVSRDVHYRADGGITVTEPPWHDNAKTNTTEL